MVVLSWRAPSKRHIKKDSIEQVQRAQELDQPLDRQRAAQLYGCGYSQVACLFERPTISRDLGVILDVKILKRY